MRDFQHPKLGQTLIELLVYAALVVIIGGIVTTMLVAMQRAIAQTLVARRVQATAAVVLERIVRDARVAHDIDELASTLGVHPGRVTLLVRDEGGGPDVAYAFEAVASALEVRRNGVLEGSLTPDTVSVANLVFREVVTPVSEALRIELTLHAEQGRASSTEKFYVTTVLRDSYQLE
ncbi:MAG: hypothetical protein Q8R39_04420 [bacterium]|nr:hypothetical protein [bacterium]MDZ4284567.1 hypothetical protein [Patescibacteria group bacterium]